MLTSYNILIGIVVNSYLYSLSTIYNLNITTIKIPSAYYFDKDYDTYRTFDIVTKLINNNKIKTITEDIGLAPHTIETDAILNNSTSTSLQIIDIDVNCYNIDNILNKFKKYKTDQIYFYNY